MEFWGIEVKSGESLKVDPGDDKIIHLSNACLGDVTTDKGGEPVALYVKFGSQKLVLGTLSSDKFPQISYDLIFEKEFELSHNWKNGSVFFTGFKAQAQLGSDNDEDSDDFDEDIPVSAANGRPEIEVKNGAKPDIDETKKKIADPRKNGKAKEKDPIGEDEDSSDSEDDSSEDKPTMNGDIESSEGDDDSNGEDEDDDESDDEETPKKIEASNKRNIDSSKKTPVPVKKAKFVTPQKTDSKNVVHVATPYPSKQAGKASGNNKQQTAKSGGDYCCKPCNRSFKTEDALNSHNKAKHSAK